MGKIKEIKLHPNTDPLSQLWFVDDTMLMGALTVR
jgi:hypothetical protein